MAVLRGRWRLTTRQKMLLARGVQRPVLVARAATGRGPTTQVARQGVRWHIDLRDGIDFAIWLQGAFEPATVSACRRLARPGATALDIGANVGAHTLHLAGAVGPTGRVVAFEPVDRSYRRLLDNLVLNPELAGRVDAAQVMLLGSDGQALPSLVLSSWPLLPRRELAAIPGEALPTSGAVVRTLDTALAERGVGRVDLVKLDVDGYECEVLAGADSMLRRDRPVIVTELAPYVHEGADAFDDLLERFADLDYRLTDLRDRPVDDATIVGLRTVSASMNVIARPAS